MDDIDVASLQFLYRRIYDLLGKEEMLEMYNEFKGTQLNLPMRLYDRELAAVAIKKLYPEKSVKELADKYGYSQRWVQQVLKQ